MDIFTQKRSLIRIIIILVILNFSLLVFVLWKELWQPNPQDRPTHEKVAEILRTELQLSDDQVNEFERIRKEFFIKEKRLESAIRNARDSMNIEMFNKHINEERVKSLAKNISLNEFNMEMLRLEQAKQLKTICTSEQLEKFESLVQEIRDYFQPEPPKQKK